MSEWWTYLPSDFLMFSARSWYRLLALHNEAWAPAQAVTTLLGALVLVSLYSRSTGLRRVALALTGVAWLLVAWSFHAARYAQINWAATYFAAAFAFEGALLITMALPTPRPQREQRPVVGVAATALVLLALLYPLLALALKRPLTQSEWAGLMPDPTAVATLGLLLGLADIVRGLYGTLMWSLALAPPLLWCAISGVTLWTMKAPEWAVAPTLAAAALVAALGVRRRGA
ncbi:MAG TPA: DUF6064 family protein [Ramlibacter sp.]|nr:DUF6064 family protein [Ramlibacter sp.]